MYNKNPQITIFEATETFMMPTVLDPNNRWVRMSKLIPWNMVEKKYSKQIEYSGGLAAYVVPGLPNPCKGLRRSATPIYAYALREKQGSK